MKVYFINGALNTQQSAGQTTQSLTQKSQISVELIWNGVYCKCLERETEENVTEKIIKVVSQHVHGVCLLAHSHGALVTYNALEKFRKSQSADNLCDREIYVFTFGGITHISAHLGKRVINFENRCKSDWASSAAHSRAVLGSPVSHWFSRIQDGYPIFTMEAGGNGHYNDTGYEEAMLKVLDYVNSKTKEWGVAKKSPVPVQQVCNYGKSLLYGSQNHPDLVDNEGVLFRLAEAKVKLSRNTLLDLWCKIKGRLGPQCELSVIQDQKSAYLSKKHNEDLAKTCATGNSSSIAKSAREPMENPQNSNPKQKPTVSGKSTSQASPRAKAKHDEGCCGCLIA